MTMQQILLSALACCALVFPWAISAPTVDTAPCTLDASYTCATGISDLAVWGRLYDVTFVANGSYNDIYAGNPSPFLGDQPGAIAADQAILNALSPSGVDGVLSRSNYYDYFLVPYKLYGAADSYPGAVDLAYGYFGGYGWYGVYDCSAGCLVANYDYSNSSYFPNYSFNWAVFTAAPEPATFALLGIGLAGLGYSRRKQ